MQSLVLEELRALLRDDVSDPLLADVRFVAAVLSVDCRHARVYFALARASPGEPRDVQWALQRATPFFRARLAEAIEMKRVPELRFVFDAAVGASDE